jgi:hypothetical protein
MLDQTIDSVSHGSMMNMAWTILEAANDLEDGKTVEVCRRIIDAALRGRTPAQSDVNTIAGFFD